MQYLKHPDTGKSCIANKVIKALEKKSIKEWAYAIHDKDHGLAEFSLLQ